MTALDVNALKEDLLEKLQHAGYRDKLQFIYLFGSAAAGKATDQSDIDICVHYSGLSPEAMQHLYVTVPTLLSEYDVAFFTLLPLHIQKTVFAGTLVYCKNEEQVYDLALQTLKRYADFEKQYRLVIA